MKPMKWHYESEKRDCHNCQRQKIGQVCLMERERIDTCLKDDKRPFWVSKSDQIGRKTETQELIFKECNQIREMLLEKNRKYGDAAINPVRIFSKSDPEEQIFIRLDDKISRWKNRQSDDDEDIISDLIGYLILYRVIRRLEK